MTKMNLSRFQLFLSFKEKIALYAFEEYLEKERTRDQTWPWPTLWRFRLGSICKTRVFIRYFWHVQNNELMGQTK